MEQSCTFRLKSIFIIDSISLIFWPTFLIFSWCQYSSDTLNVDKEKALLGKIITAVTFVIFVIFYIVNLIKVYNYQLTLKVFMRIVLLGGFGTGGMMIVLYIKKKREISLISIVGSGLALLIITFCLDVCDCKTEQSDGQPKFEPHPILRSNNQKYNYYTKKNKDFNYSLFQDEDDSINPSSFSPLTQSRLKDDDN